MEEQKKFDFEGFQKDLDENLNSQKEEPASMAAERPIAWNGEWAAPQKEAPKEVLEEISQEETSQAEDPIFAEPPKAEEPQPMEMPQTEAPQSAQEEAKAEEQPRFYQPPYRPSGNGYHPPYRQGGYSYQNPNPYQNYQWQAPPQPIKKERNSFFMVATIIAVVIIALSCVAVVLAELNTFDKWLETGSSQGEAVNPPSQEEEKPKEEGGKDSDQDSAQRQDGAVYNAPEISTEKKKGEALSLVEINKKVKDSVVGILIATAEEEDAEFSGSGFIISEDGYIITNEHVVSKAKHVKVVLSDGITEYQAVIVGKDSQADLAILKVDAKGLAAAELGDSSELEVGELVVAIGNPYGMVLAGSMTDGIVSALNRKMEINGSFMTLIQTNASINPGNSGGPLVNAYGQVVGICSSKLVATDYEGIGFAIPINDVVNLSDELINYGYIRTRAYIGIMGSDLQEAYCKYHGIPQGVYVSYVDPECSAAKKGMKEGDIIIGFNGQELSSMAQLNELKNEFRPGDTVKVKVWREKKELEFEIVLGESSN